MKRWEETGAYSLPFYIRKMDTTGYREEHQIPETSLPMIGFMFLRQGECLVHVDGSPIMVETGQIIIIPEGIPFAIRHYKDCIGYSGAFRLDYLKDASWRFLHGRKPVIHGFWFEKAVFFAGLFDMIFSESQIEDSQFPRIALDLVLSQIKDESSKENVSTLFLDQVFDPKQPYLPVGEYAALLGISPSHLNKSVRRKTGRSPQQWINTSKIARSKELLRNPKLSISEVSYQVDIDDPSYFSRFFKSQTGQTPYEFRKSILKKS